jgi:trk system potassium uptake protein TrkA
MVIGAGETGMPLIKHLSERGHILTVVDKNEEICEEVSDCADAAIFQGSGTDSELWNSFGAEKMDALLALTNDDEVNAKLCRTAKQQYGIPTVIVRVHEPENVPIMKDAGADVTICPAQETTRLFLNALENGTKDTIYELEEANFKAIAATVPVNGSIIGKTIEKLGLPDNCRISCVIRNQATIFQDDSLTLKGGDRVLILGQVEAVDKIADKIMYEEIS